MSDERDSSEDLGMTVASFYVHKQYPFCGFSQNDMWKFTCHSERSLRSKESLRIYIDPVFFYFRIVHMISLFLIHA